MHGGASTGAPTGKAHGAYRTGMHTLEMAEVRRSFRALIQAAREAVARV